MAADGRPLQSPVVTDPARPLVDHRAFHAAVAERLAAGRSGPGWPVAELADIDTALRRRTRRSASANLTAHLRALDDAADIDIDPPTASNSTAGRSVKVAISRATGWYVGHIAGQLRHLAVATSRAVRATAARVDDLDARVSALEEAAATGPIRDQPGPDAGAGRS
jgi:hypothetical protein